MADQNSDPTLKRIILQASLGVLTAAPVGVFLYFFPVLVWASFFSVLAFLVVLMPTIGSAVAAWMNFSPGMFFLLAGSAIAAELLFCRALIRQRYSVFACTQAILGLAVSSPIYYWSIVHQKPILPFWGQ